MAAKVEIILQGTDNASRPIRDVNQALTEVGEKGKGSFGILQSAASSALGFIGAQAGIAFTGMVGSAVSAGAEYGAVMNRIQAVSGATAGEMDLINKQALKLGADLPISAADAAQGMYALVTAGYSAKDAIAASGGVAALAASQQMEVGRASEIVSAALRGFGLEADQAGRVTDLLSQTASRSAVEVADVGETLKYVGPVAGALKQPIEDISAAIALMGNSGVKGSMAGTALRTTLTNMVQPSEAAGAAMASLGIQITDGTAQVAKSSKEVEDDLKSWHKTTLDASQIPELKTALQELGYTHFPTTKKGAFDTAEAMKLLKGSLDSDTTSVEDKNRAMAALGLSYTRTSGEMLPLMDIMQQFREKTAGMTDEQKASLASTLAGKEAMSGFLAILSASDADFNGMRDSMANAEGATAKFASSMNKGLKFEIEQLKGSIETVLIQGFQAVEPVMVGVVSAITPLVNQVGENLPGAMAAAQTAWDTVLYPALQTAGAFISTNVVPVLMTLGLWLQTNVPVAVAAASDAWTTTLYPALQTAWGFIQANIIPVLATLVGWLADNLPGAIAVVVGHWDTLAKIAAVVGAALGAAGLVGVITSVVGVVGTFITVVGGLWATLTAGGAVVTGIGALIALLGGPITIVVGLIAALAVAWSTNLFGIRDKTEEVWNAITTFTSTFWTNLSGAWTRNVEEIRSAWNGWTASLSAAWDNWHSGVQAAVATFWGNLVGAWERNRTDIRTAWDGWTSSLSSAWDTWHTSVSGAVTTWWGGVKDKWGEVQGTVRTNWDSWKDGLATAWGSWQGGIATAVSTWWSTDVSGTWDTWRGTVRTNWDTWSSGLAGAWDTWQGGITTAVGSWWGTVSGAWDTWRGTIRSNWDTWSGLIGTAWDTWQDGIQAAVGLFRQALEGDWQGLGETLKRLWNEGWEAIKTAVGTLGGQVVAAVGTLIADIIAKFTDTDWGAVGTGIVDGIKAGLSAGVESIKNAARDVAKAALEAAKGFLGISSPSEVFRDEVGVEIVNGIIAGLTSATPDLAAQMTLVTETMTSMMTGESGPLANAADMGGAVMTVYAGGLSMTTPASDAILPAVTEVAAMMVGDTGPLANAAEMGASVVAEYGSGIESGVQEQANSLMQLVARIGQAFTNAMKSVDFGELSAQIPEGALDEHGYIPRLARIADMMAWFLNRMDAIGDIASQLGGVTTATTQVWRDTVLRLGKFLVSIAQPIHRLIDDFDNDVAGSLADLAKTGQAIQDVIDGTVGVVTDLFEKVAGTRIEQALNDAAQMNWLAQLAEGVVYLGRMIATEVGKVKIVIDQDVAGQMKLLSDILSPVKSTIDNTVGIVTDLLDKVVGPKLETTILNSPAAVNWISQLAKGMVWLGTQIAGAVDDIQFEIDDKVLAGLKKLSDTLSPVKSALDNTVGIVKTVTEGDAVPPDASSRAAALVRAGLDVARSVLGIANAFGSQAGEGATAASQALPLVGKMLQDAIALLRVVAEGGTVGGADAVGKTLSALSTLLLALVDASGQGGMRAGESWSDAFKRGVVTGLDGWTPFPGEGSGGKGSGGGVLGEFASGGAVGRTGRYLLHAGEVVMNPQQQQRLAANMVGASAGGRGDTYHYTVNQTVYSVTGLEDTLNWLKSQGR